MRRRVKYTVRQPKVRTKRRDQFTASIKTMMQATRNVVVNKQQSLVLMKNMVRESFFVRVNLDLKIFF